MNIHVSVDTDGRVIHNKALGPAPGDNVIDVVAEKAEARADPEPTTAARPATPRPAAPGPPEEPSRVRHWMEKRVKEAPAEAAANADAARGHGKGRFRVF